MTPIFCNREFQRSADGWILAVPAGELYNAEAGVMQVMDPASLRSIVADWDEQRQRLGENFPGIYVGVEHHIYDPALSSAALGWAKEWRIDEKGIWIRVEWTDLGDEAIRNRRFKFTSFCVDPNAPKSLQSLGNDRFRVLKVHTIGLTNLPNGKDLLIPITNRVGAETQPGGGLEAASRSFALVVNRIRVERNCTFDAAWNLARQQECGALAENAAISSRPPATPVLNRAVAPEVDFPRLASEVLLGKARGEQLASGGRFDEHWKRICNRSPRLLRIANRQAGWDALADLEPAAHAEYMRARTNPNVFSSEIQDAMTALRSQFPNLRPDEQTQKLNELYPQVLSQYRLEQAASDPRFEAAMQSITIQFPDLGFEGRWEKLKEIYPKLFWKFVLTCGSKSEQAP